jgi:hypothetical protein
MAFILIMVPVCRMRQLKQFNRDDFSSAVIELFVLIVFLLQLFLMQSSQVTSEFLAGRNGDLAIDSSFETEFLKRYVDYITIFIYLLYLLRFS